MKIELSTPLISPAQCRAARALLDLTQKQLAADASQGLSTIVHFESERRNPSRRLLGRLRTTLETAGVIFIGDDGVRLRHGARPEYRPEQEPVPAKARKAVSLGGRPVSGGVNPRVRESSAG